MQTLMNTFLILSISVVVISSCSTSGNEAMTSDKELSSSLCFDNLDGDGDGKVDCEDSDCCWACLPECGGDPDCEGEDWVMKQLVESDAPRAL